MSEATVIDANSSPAEMTEFEPCHFTTGTLGSGYLHEAVKQPEGESLNEWVALNVNDIFKHINKACGTLTKYCTVERCPVMSAGANIYTWHDGKTVSPCVSAPQYIDSVLTWVQCQLDDDDTFPSELDQEFPAHFMSVVKVIMKRLFRLYAHIYHHHFSDMQTLNAEAHLNTAFKYFIYFSREFSLLSDPELAPLTELITCIFSKNGR